MYQKYSSRDRKVLSKCKYGMTNGYHPNTRPHEHAFINTSAHTGTEGGYLLQEKPYQVPSISTIRGLAMPVLTLRLALRPEVVRAILGDVHALHGAV